MSYTVSFEVNVYNARELRKAATDKALGDCNLTRQEWADWRRRAGTIEACLAILFEPASSDLKPGFDIEDSHVT